MEPGTWQLILIVVLILISAFLSASETALLSLSKIRLRHMVEEEVKGAYLVQGLLDDSSKVVITILIGDNISNVAATALGAKLAIEWYGYGALPVTIAVMAIIVIIFGEMIPKTMASQHSEPVSLFVARPINAVKVLLTPIVFLFQKASSLLILILGGNPKKTGPAITEEDLKTLVDVGSEEGVLEVGEKEMLFNVFEFGDLQVKDVMVQRIDIVALDARSTYQEVVDVILSEQFSRLPVYKEDIDDIIGILNVKDLIFLSDDEKKDFNLENIVRDVYFTYEFKKIIDLFKELKKERTHMAIVLDEYGGTVGIATIEDLLEEIVGEIGDEYDDEETVDIEVIKEDEYIVTGSFRLDELNEEIGTTIESEEFDSVGGYLIGVLGTFPENGQVIESEGIRFIVEEVDKNRIKKVRIFT